MINKSLPFQQDPKHRKNNSKLQINTYKNQTRNNGQIQSRLTPQLNNTSSAKMSNNISKYSIMQSKLASRHIEVHDDEQQRLKLLLQIGGYFSQSQNKSQIISIHQLEQYQPILMSSINNNLKRNFKLLSYTKIRNNIEELRAIQTDFIEYFSEQREFLTSQMQKMADYLLKKSKVQPQNLPNAQIIQQIFEKNKIIASLECKVQLKDQQNAKIKKELSNIRILLQKQQQKSKQLQKVNNKKLQRSNANYQTQNCLNCKILQIKCDALRQQLVYLEQLKSQNQSLQEYIFDIQQQIVGIDIEVQKRVAQHLKLIDQSNTNKMPSLPTKEQSENYIQILRKLNDQNAFLQQKCDHLEKNTIKQRQLAQLQKRLNQKQINYQRKENQLFQSLAKHEKDKENVYQKEHYALIKEEQIQNKMVELNKRQLQLGQWQSMLINQIQLPNILPSIQQREDLHQQNHLINQATINSFGKIQQQHAHRYDQDKKYLGRSKSDNLFIPELQIHKNQSDSLFHTNYEAKLQRQYPIFNKHSQNSRYQTNKVYTQILKKNQDHGDHNYNMKRKHQIQLNQMIGHRREKSSQALSNKSPKHYRQSSKSSKIYAGKASRSNYIPSYTPINERPGLRPNTVGLTSKLDRLREQIKRQIKSIV